MADMKWFNDNQDEYYEKRIAALASFGYHCNSNRMLRVKVRDGAALVIGDLIADIVGAEDTPRRGVVDILNYRAGKDSFVELYFAT